MNCVVVINPGTGPVAGGRFPSARKNLRVFVEDLSTLGVDRVRFDPLIGSEPVDRGRVAVRLRRGKRSAVVEMPMIPLRRVRYIDRNHQNIWHFPRLYVDGGSWVWIYALYYAADVLTGRYDDAETEGNSWECCWEPAAARLRAKR